MTVSNLIQRPPVSNLIRERSDEGIDDDLHDRFAGEHDSHSHVFVGESSVTQLASTSHFSFRIRFCIRFRSHFCTLNSPVRSVLTFLVIVHYL